MTAFTDVFERKEVKYRLDARQAETMRRALEGRMAPDVYGCTTVRSLYLDTPERALIERSLDKPLYKEKLRLRCYGTPTDDSLVFVEIKKKYKGIVYKRRVGCSYAAARAFLGGVSYEDACACFPLADAGAAAESCAPRSLQIAAEIDQLLVRHAPLVPSMLIRCERVAYAPVPKPPVDVPCNLRITFDERIVYRDLFASDSSTTPLLRTGEAVMEVKASGPFPLWLVRALGEGHVYPTSFSKYGAAYRACEPMLRPVAEAPEVERRGAHTLQAAADQQAERFAAAPRSSHPRRFRAPAMTSAKKGGRCA